MIVPDSDESMPEVMEFMHQRISEKYRILFFKQDEAGHLQNYIMSNLPGIDIGYGGYENAAACKHAFIIRYDRSGTIEGKMIRSREWMDDHTQGLQVPGFFVFDRYNCASGYGIIPLYVFEEARNRA